MANSVIVSSLTKYTDQLAEPLLRESVLKGKTVNLVSIRQGIKYAEALNIMTSTLTAAAQACGAISPATNAVTLAQQSLQVCPLMIQEVICWNELEKYWMGQFAKTDGSYAEAAPEVLAQVYMQDKVAKIQKLVDDILWKGNVSTGSDNLALCDGIIAKLEDYSGVVTTSYASPAVAANLTLANAINTVEDMIDLIPEAVLDQTDLTLFCSLTNFRTIARALKALNNYYIDGTAGVNYEMIYPGSNVKIVGVGGLTNKFDMILTPASNIYFGTDMMTDIEGGYQTWYEKKDDSIYFRAKWKQGVAVAYPQYVVWFNGKPTL